MLYPSPSFLLAIAALLFISVPAALAGPSTAQDDDNGDEDVKWVTIYSTLSSPLQASVQANVLPHRHIPALQHLSPIADAQPTVLVTKIVEVTEKTTKHVKATGASHPTNKNPHNSLPSSPSFSEDFAAVEDLAAAVEEVQSAAEAEKAGKKKKTKSSSSSSSGVTETETETVVMTKEKELQTTWISGKMYVGSPCATVGTMVTVTLPGPAPETTS